MNTTVREDLFAQIGEDVDFIGDIVRNDVPVLTYRWSNGSAVSNVGAAELLRWGRDAMVELGLTNIRWQGLHLRSDSTSGQRVKMTVLNSHGQSTYLLMTAGMPGTRKEAKQLNRQIAEHIERRSQRFTEQTVDDEHAFHPSAEQTLVRTLTGTSVH